MTRQDNRVGNRKRSRDHVPKLRPVNIPAVSIQIGSWREASVNGNDLTAKIYYAKRRLIWEVLYHQLKKKIEIQWEDIIGIHAVLEQGKRGILEIELKQPPKFYQEMPLNLCSHSKWAPTQDFTNGQASIYRRHRLEFDANLLDVPCENLLACDGNHFRNMSLQPFPTSNSPFFDSPSSHCYHENTQIPNIGIGSRFPPNLQTRHHSSATFAPFPASLQNLPALSQFDWNSISLASAVENQSTPLWNQNEEIIYNGGVANMQYGRPQFQGRIPSIATQTLAPVPSPLHTFQYESQQNLSAIARFDWNSISTASPVEHEIISVLNQVEGEMNNGGVNMQYETQQLQGRIPFAATQTLAPIPRPMQDFSRELQQISPPMNPLDQDSIPPATAFENLRMPLLNQVEGQMMNNGRVNMQYQTHQLQGRIHSNETQAGQTRTYGVQNSMTSAGPAEQVEELVNNQIRNDLDPQAGSISFKDEEVIFSANFLFSSPDLGIGEVVKNFIRRPSNLKASDSEDASGGLMGQVPYANLGGSWNGAFEVLEVLDSPLADLQFESDPWDLYPQNF